MSGTSKVRFAGFRPSLRREGWGALLALGLAGLAPAPGQAGSADTTSFVYCLDQHGAKIFAGKELADGSLVFGLSVWSPAGHNLSLFGTAAQHGRGWQYVDDQQAEAATERCRLEITPLSNRALRVESDQTATCQSHGGANTEVGTLLFPSSSYEGTVTTQLDGPEAFQKAGNCVGAGH